MTTLTLWWTALVASSIVFVAVALLLGLIVAASRSVERHAAAITATGEQIAREHRAHPGARARDRHRPGDSLCDRRSEPGTRAAFRDDRCDGARQAVDGGAHWLSAACAGLLLAGLLGLVATMLRLMWLVHGVLRDVDRTPPEYRGAHGAARRPARRGRRRRGSHVRTSALCRGGDASCAHGDRKGWLNADRHPRHLVHRPRRRAAPDDRHLQDRPPGDRHAEGFLPELSRTIDRAAHGIDRNVSVIPSVPDLRPAAQQLVDVTLAAESSLQSIARSAEHLQGTP